MIDDLRMAGKIDQKEWSLLFDDLSNTRCWSAEGRIISDPIPDDDDPVDLPQKQS